MRDFSRIPILKHVLRFAISAIHNTSIAGAVSATADLCGAHYLERRLEPQRLQTGAL